MPVPTPAQFHAYEHAHEAIAAAIAELTPAQMQVSPAPGEWNIQQILIHLPDSEVVGYERLRRTIAEERPALQAYDEEAWGSRLHYHQQDPHLALELFKLLRRASTGLLHQLPAEAWERVGMHSENGEMSLYSIFLAYLSHGEAHLQQIEQVKRGL